MDVVAPVPWVPRVPLPRSWDRFSRIPPTHQWGAVRVSYPRYFTLPFRVAFFLEGRDFVWALRRAALSGRYDLIWAHYAYPDGWASVRFARDVALPVIVTVRGEDVRTDVRHFGVREQVRWALREATVVTSPHPETSDLARGLGRRDIFELHNGIDLARYAGGDGQPIRQELGLTDEFVVAFVGHLIKNKDPRTLVEAIAMVPRDAGVVAVFAGSAGRGRDQADLPGLAARLGVQDRVRFLGDRPDVPDVLAAAQVFAQIDVVENIWSNSMLEAMAAGVPCIVTRSGTTERWLVHGRDAWLIPPRSPAALAAAILRLKRDDGLRTELAKHAKALVTSGFDLEAVEARALALCRSTTQAHRVG